MACADDARQRVADPDAAAAEAEAEAEFDELRAEPGGSDANRMSAAAAMANPPP